MGITTRGRLGSLPGVLLLAFALSGGGPTGTWAQGTPLPSSVEISTEVKVTTVPDALVPWVPWVLESSPAGQDQRTCSLDVRTGERVCAWPGRLDLVLDRRGGFFEQDWVVQAPSWVPLPGEPGAWPLEVRSDGRDLPVLPRAGLPSVRLAVGAHRLTGQFRWERLPDALEIPPVVGWVALEREGRAVSASRLDGEHRLWLTGPLELEGERAGDRITVTVYRRIDDTLPLEVLTRLELEVSGRTREWILGPVLLPGGLPLNIESPLPVRLEADAMLRVQVRPGRWVLEIAASHPGAVSELRAPSDVTAWPAHEIWAFAARPELRRVSLSGGAAIDPGQTGIPADWHGLPVFRVEPGESLKLAEQRRGDADPAPDRLQLERRIWLDFDGRGFSVQDRLSGQLTRSWRLNAGPLLELGQVRVDERPVLITRLAAEAPDGVEVRRGQLALVADARIEASPGVIPASGWAFALESVKTRLELPPGWELWMVSGVDDQPDTWVGRWSLLDLFLVLILVIGIGRLKGMLWGGIALVALGLTWQEPGAPRFIWLHLLGAAALMRFIPSAPIGTGLWRVRAIVRGYFHLSLVVLLIIGLPFLVGQVREGLFPHLEQPWMVPGDTLRSQANSLGILPFVGSGSAKLDGLLAEERAPPTLTRPSKSGETVTSVPEPIDAFDPGALLQTGAGVPEWSWRGYDLVWNGPVGERDSARIWLTGPIWNLVLSLSGALLMALLALRIGGLFEKRVRPGATTLLLVLVLGCGTLLGQAPAIAGEIPSPALLEELRARLLMPPDCVPACVDLSQLSLRADEERLEILMTLDAAVAVAAPLPEWLGGWSAASILVNEAPPDGVRRSPDGTLMVPLPPGRHQVSLAGALQERDQVEIPLPLAPRRMDTQIDGWLLEGLDAEGRPGAQLRLIRIMDEQGSAAFQPTGAADALPFLLRVQRTLLIGIDWQVETRVQRLSRKEDPVLVKVPLLPGESVQTPDVQVEDESVLVDLPGGRLEYLWTSRLEPSSELQLSASLYTGLSEEWRVDLGPLWHLEYEGLAPVHQGDTSGRRMPTWRPRPGETLRLAIRRPLGVPGPTLTIDRVEFLTQAGQRGALTHLVMSIRSSQGGAHPMQLPQGVEPVAFRIDGRELPLPILDDPSSAHASRHAPLALEIPLTPGTARVEVSWREPGARGLLHRALSPDLGARAVNLNLSMQIPQDRWLLWAWGPRLGPVVLFWASLLVLLGIAIGLARVRLTPLRFHDWFLLGIGLMLAQLWVALVVTGWLLALGVRHRMGQSDWAPWRFNLMQVALVVLTLMAFSGLLGAVQQGLLGTPDMQVMGNGSSAAGLKWYQDTGGPQLPEVGMFSVPLWVYRILMLAWALWLAVRFLDWLRWGWQALSKPMLWREMRLSARSS